MIHIDVAVLNCPAPNYRKHGNFGAIRRVQEDVAELPPADRIRFALIGTEQGMASFDVAYHRQVVGEEPRKYTQQKGLKPI